MTTQQVCARAELHSGCYNLKDVTNGYHGQVPVGPTKGPKTSPNGLGHMLIGGPPNLKSTVSIMIKIWATKNQQLETRIEISPVSSQRYCLLDFNPTVSTVIG